MLLNDFIDGFFNSSSICSLYCSFVSDNSPKIKVYAPKEGPNDSSKYNMFEFNLEGEGQVQITLAGGANEGEKYEQGLLEKFLIVWSLSVYRLHHKDQAIQNSKHSSSQCQA